MFIYILNVHVQTTPEIIFAHPGNCLQLNNSFQTNGKNLKFHLVDKTKKERE